MRHVLYVTLIVSMCYAPSWARDPELLDKGRRYQQVIEAAKDALDSTGPANDQQRNLQAALVGLHQFSKQYPTFQPDSINVRMDACRLRLKILTLPDQPSKNSQHQPSALEVYNQMEQLLHENIKLRDALQSETRKTDAEPPEIAVDFQDALKTVADLNKQLKAQREANKNHQKAHTKEVAYLNDELKKLATINLELTGDSEKRGKIITQLQVALKKASGKTFSKESELKALQKKAIQLEATVTKLKADNEQAQTIIEGLKVGNTEALKKNYADTRAALLNQSALLGKERETAKQATKKMAETQKALDVLQLQNAKLRESLKLYRQGSDTVIIQELENAVAVYKEKLADSTHANEAIEKQLTEWKLINKELLESLKATATVPDAKTQQDLRKQVETQRVLLEKLRTSLRELEAEATDLEKQLATRPKSIETVVKPVNPSNAPLTDEQKQEVQLLLQQAKAAILTKAYARAKAFINDALTLDPTNSTAKTSLATIYVKEGNVVEAKRALAGVEITPTVLQLQESIHHITGSTDYFMAQLFKAVAAQPENPEIRLITAVCLRRIKYYTMAEYQLNELLKLTPASFDCAREFYFLYVSMGIEYTNLQKKWYNKALSIDSKRRNELIPDE